jgi:hypothetical protein
MRDKNELNASVLSLDCQNSTEFVESIISSFIFDDGDVEMKI